MRDILTELFENQPLDAREAARRSLRTDLRKRFYQRAGAGEDFSVLLDGKPVKTPGRGALKAPTLALAAAIAAEWEAQRETIDPAAMPLTRLANTIIDGIAPAPQQVAQEIAKYLESDLVCYRAERPAGLAASQARHWDPLLDFAREEFGARFTLTHGVVHVAQPSAAVEAARKAIPADPWPLGALAAITTLTGSALIALALLRRRVDTPSAWAAAHVDEDWQMEQWGRDEEAAARRAARFAEMQAAVTVLALAR